MNTKYSIIIPTMWYSDKTQELLIGLDNHSMVDEIILIDNNTSLKPEYIYDIKKLKYFPQKENIYVNPSWNLGVKLSYCNNLCISNDDIVFDTSILEYMQDKINTGVYGMCTSNYFKKNTNISFEVEEIKDRVWGWGCLIFIHKLNWIAIDERLKISYGDDFLLKNVKGGAYIIKNLKVIYDNISITSGKNEFLDQQKIDKEIWNQFYH